VAVLLFTTYVGAQPPANYQLDSDWLLDATKFQACVKTDRDTHRIILSNGLVRRTIGTAPNAATIGFDNLMNGASIIRAIRPEGRVRLDGIEFPIGGLVGLPDQAYFTRPWLANLRPEPNALQFVGSESGRIEPRFAWQQIRHHAPDVRWPPAGVHLQLHFVIPASAAVASAAAGLASDVARTCLFEDRFQDRDESWTMHSSTTHARSSFVNEGKIGEIYTPANTAVFAQRRVSPATRLVELTLDAGTDTSASWGPGVALAWDKKVIKFYLRPGARAEAAAQFGVWDGTHELLIKPGDKQLDMGKPWSLRLRIDADTVFCEARPVRGNWFQVAQIRVADGWGRVRDVRIGKTSRTGGADDFHGASGELGRLRIMHYAEYGAIDPARIARQTGYQDYQGVRVDVHYALYDGLPLLSKWLTLYNGSRHAVNVDRFSAEELAVVEFDNPVETREGVPLAHPDSLHVETDMAFGGFTHQRANRQSVHWRTDPSFRTQVNYRHESPCLLVVEPTYGPDQTVAPGKTFESFRVFELAYDSSDRERRGLALRKMYRTIAPWVTENPLMMHMRSARPDAVKQAIDQCHDVGFEMLILSFGSGFNAENENPDYLREWRAIADYAQARGIDMGCYSLLSSRRVDAASMIVSPPGQQPTHGQCPALTSTWGTTYFKKLRNLFQTTRFKVFEHDGSYPGDVDVTPRPPLQKGLDDSQWVQWRIISDFYKWLRGQGVYLNVPDYYFLVGSSKCGMGYRETNWSLPRAQQLIHTRQNIFDGTWAKTPSMGWMFVPLTQYHGGGAAATVEPLDEHLDHYRAMLDSNLALGVQACYRGPRLYDTDRTRAMVKQQVAWYKRYRDILESDVIHGRRADGRGLDWMLHVNPKLEQRGMLAVFNPTGAPITKTIHVPLYYTGLADSAAIQEGDAKPVTYPLNRFGQVALSVRVPAASWTWYVIQTPSPARE